MKKIVQGGSESNGYDNEVANFNQVIDKSNKSVNECSIIRMLQWLNDCDCAFISALRSKLKDMRDKSSADLEPYEDWNEDKHFTHEENRKKNKFMVAELLQLGYGVAKMKGRGPEEMTDEASEKIYLVVNRDNDENFLNNLLRISECYNQDSIYYKEKGKTKGNFIGTNNCGWPGYHQKEEDSEIKTDSASNYMSRLGVTAFSFVGRDAEKVKNRKVMEALDFWRNMIEGKLLIKEDIHPLTRKTMGEELRKMRKNRERQTETNVNGSRVFVENGEVKTIFSEQIQKTGYMTVEEAERLTLAIIEKEYDMP